MASIAQLEANARNATLSTGPRTPEGKAIVSQNRTIHGLTGKHVVLPGEDPAAFDALLEAYRDEHQPFPANSSASAATSPPPAAPGPAPSSN